MPTRRTTTCTTPIFTPRTYLQAVDLWVLAFETIDSRDGKGERALGASLFVDLAARFPETAKEMLRLLPHFASWRSVNQVHMLLQAELAAANANKSAAEASAAAHCGLKASQLEALMHAAEDLYVEQLKMDSGLLQKKPAGAAVGDKAAAAPPAVPAAAAAAPSEVAAASGAAAAAAPAATPKAKLTLAAKWAPTEGSFYDRASGLAGKIALKLFPYSKEGPAPDAHKKYAARQYRKLLAPLRAELDIVERKMASKRWREIAPTNVPGVANKKYRKALMNKPLKPSKGVALPDDPSTVVRSLDEDRVQCAANFEEAIQAVIRGDEGVKRVKGSANEPHTLTKPFMNHSAEEDTMLEAQWIDMRKTLAENGNFTPGLCMVDVSGSMGGLPMEVSIALGILLSQLLPAPWTGRFLTFDSNPTWHDISGCASLRECVRSTMRAPWGGSTNFFGALNSILDEAVKAGVPNDLMPRTLFVFSDMQFNQATPGAYGQQGNMEDSVFKHAGDDVRARFQAAGYQTPHIVFWNLRAGGTPSFQAEADTPGVSMVSGYSQQLMKDFMEQGVFLTQRPVTPWETLNNKLTKDLYYPVREVCAASGEGVLEPYAFEPFADDRAEFEEAAREAQLSALHSKE